MVAKQTPTTPNLGASNKSNRIFKIAAKVLEKNNTFVLLTATKY